ncbi:hypothetical protein [Teichococcus vastitatis]|jgi:hypothetical protein|uniref:DUF2171 domain-containing protein n=1 Tax=Teichococcus vastitatis TaxID=2307076 RepID=A0ABS9VZF3_9PROT|nr:hypothetical protein [Pseudoroseomonas vastitatis]MCI0752297.1 DUF2171 domain-containing protein [Pseudoroseomonas vastitatis]
MVDTTLLRDGMPVMTSDGALLGRIGGFQTGHVELVAQDGRLGVLPLSEFSTVEQDKATCQLTRDEALLMMQSQEAGRHTEA